MRETKSTRMHFTYSGKAYIISIDSIRYTATLVINKLNIGYARYWLVLHGGDWQVVGDMPLCPKLKHKIVDKICTWHKIFMGREFTESGPAAAKTGLLLNQLHCVMTFDHQLP